MHSWGSDRKGKSELLCTDCAAPGLHWSLASGLTRKVMCMLKRDIELKLVLNSPEGICFLGKRPGSICTCLLLPPVLPGCDQFWANLGAFFCATKPQQRDILFSRVSQISRHLFPTEEPNVRNMIYFLACKKSTDKCQALLNTLLLLCLCCLTMVHMESKANCISTGVQQEAYWSWVWKAELRGLCLLQLPVPKRSLLWAGNIHTLPHTRTGLRKFHIAELLKLLNTKTKDVSYRRLIEV